LSEFAVSECSAERAAPEITVRLATEADTAAMIPVINAAFEEEAFFLNRPRTYPGLMLEHFHTGQFLVAEEQGRVLASVYCEVRGVSGYIGMLAVAPQAQRRGLGARMMHAAEDALRAAGCRWAEITVVNLRTGLFPMYHKLGYGERGPTRIPEELQVKLTQPIELIGMEKAL
jgi:ribosomal protein S18 acetylase RimI-like enzyme